MHWKVKDTLCILSEVGEMACGSITINTAAGCGLCTGRLEQPEKMQPERAGWLCSPNQKINITQTVMTKAQKSFTCFSMAHYFWENLCECYKSCGSCQKQATPASFQECVLHSPMYLNKLCRSRGGAMKEHFDREF